MAAPLVTLIAVTCPPGAGPGATVAVAHNGQQLQLQVPPGDRLTAARGTAGWDASDVTGTALSKKISLLHVP